MRLRQCINVALCLFITQFLTAETLRIALIENTESNDFNVQLDELFRKEINDLLSDEYTIEFMSLEVSASSNANQIFTLLDRAYSETAVDAVIVLDFPSHLLAGQKESYAKPTFLPLVFNGQIIGYPLEGESSGVNNLSYLTFEFSISEELAALQRVYPFEKAVFITGERITASIAASTTSQLSEQARNNGVDLTFVTYNDDHARTLATFPANTEAVFIGALPNVSEQMQAAFVKRLTESGIASFSVAGENLLKLGALATNSPDTDWERLARRTALNLQEVLLGRPASEIPVFFQSRNRLMINMQTARELGISPSFDILSESVVINRDPIPDGPSYSLSEVAIKAVNENLAIAVQRLRAEQAREDINIARGALLPTVSASVGHDIRRETASTRAGLIARSTTDAAVSLRMPLFNEELWANYAVRKYTSLSQQELLRQTELDIVQSAVVTYLDVLRAQTSLEQERQNLDITASNLRLAQDRVEAGSTNASDLFRWQSELANAKQSVLFAKSNLEQRKQALNAILNRPIDESFQTSVETLDNPDLLVSNKHVVNSVNNPTSLDSLTTFFVLKGLEQSPELKQIELAIKSNKRLKDSNQRDFWMPDVSLVATYNRNLDEDREGVIETEEYDWIVGFEVSLPLFEGGARFAEVKRSSLAILETESQLRDAQNSVEQSIRNSAESVHASYLAIKFAREAEVAIEKSYELTADSYAQGNVSIIDLLDAQESLLNAREASMNSVYNFLIELMQLQRASGAFDFFLTAEERAALSNAILSTVK